MLDVGIIDQCGRLLVCNGRIRPYLKAPPTTVTAHCPGLSIPAAASAVKEESEPCKTSKAGSQFFEPYSVRMCEGFGKESPLGQHGC